MTPQEKRFYEDLKKNGKRQEWSWYTQKYFPGHQLEYSRQLAKRLGFMIKKPAAIVRRPVIVKDNTGGKPTPQEKAFLARLKKEGVWASFAQMSQDCNPGGHTEWAKDVMRRYNYVVKERPATPQTKVEDNRRSSELNEIREQNRELSNQILLMERALEKYVNIQGYDPKKFSIPEPSKGGPHEATAIYQWTDWHCEESILSTTVNGLNSYDLKIAKQRATKLFENGVKLIDTQRNSVDINELVIHLGGDFITGYIHPEGEQTNLLSPIDACKYAIDLIVAGIEYNLKHANVKKIRIVCSRGNHGRTTQKKQSNDYEMNNEVFIYYFLMTYFKGEPRVVFLVDESEFSYMEIYGRVCRFFHGDQVKYKGGIGGMTVPMYKLVLRLDANRPAYWNFMGDKHTRCNPIPNVSVNGSLCGFNAYAARLGLKYEPPMQSFSLMDSKRGITIQAPIFVD